MQTHFDTSARLLLKICEKGEIACSLPYNVFNSFNPFPHTTILQQTTLNIFCQKWLISIIKWITYNWKWKTLWQNEKLLVLSNFFFCHSVFKKPSAAEASESVYMRERVKSIYTFISRDLMYFWLNVLLSAANLLYVGKSIQFQLASIILFMNLFCLC